MADLFISETQAETDVLSCAAFLAERIKSSDGHADAIAAVIPRYLRRGEVDLTAELANAVEDPFSRDKFLVQVAERCAAIGDEEYALQLIEAVEDHGMQTEALERVATAEAVAGDLDKAAEIAETMPHADFVYAAIAVQQAKRGLDPSESLSEIDFPAAKVTALQQMATDQIVVGNAEMAIEYVDQSAVEVDEIEHEEELLRHLCDIGDLYISAGRKDRAIETYDKARTAAEALDNIHRDAYLARCAVGFLEAGSTELSERTLEIVTDKTELAAALVGVARHEWNDGEKTAAVETLDEAREMINSQRDNEIRDSRLRDRLIGTLAAQYAGFGNADTAVEVALSIADPAARTAAVSEVCRVLALAGDDEGAKDALLSLHDEADQVMAMIGMADAKRQADDDSAARAILHEALATVDAILQPAPRATALNRIATRLYDLGDEDNVRAAVAQSFEAIAHIRDESRRAIALAELSDLVDEKLGVSDDVRGSLRGFVAAARW